MQGILYVVGTPIGNLGDISPRAVASLREADFIAAEDTRVTIKLLNHLDIKTPMVSAHEHNEQRRSGIIISRILAGENCALVTDAGMPCISDPGGIVVNSAHEAGIEVVSVPGPSAVMAALSIAGLNSVRFCFEGFLSTARAARREHLDSLKDELRTMVFYEAPHKLRATLSDMLAAFGDRKVAVCREMTKRHEQVLRMTLSEAVEYYSSTDPRGEYVLLITGALPPGRPEFSYEQAAAIASGFVREGLSPSEAAKRAAKETGVPKGRIYTMLHIQEDK